MLAHPTKIFLITEIENHSSHKNFCYCKAKRLIIIKETIEEFHNAILMLEKNILMTSKCIVQFGSY